MRSAFGLFLALIIVALIFLAGFVQGLSERVHELQDQQRIMLRKVDKL